MGTRADAEAESRFRELFDRHRRSVFVYFLRRVDAEDAADLTEDVFLVAWRRLADVPAGEAALPWLYGVARRVLLNQRRSRNRRRRLLAKLAFQPPPSPAGPEHLALDHIETEALIRAMATLREADQEVLRLTYWERLPHAAVAEVLGCSADAVHVRRYRAVRRLRNALARAGHKQHEAITTPGGG